MTSESWTSAVHSDKARAKPTLNQIPAVRSLCDKFGCETPIFGLSHDPSVVAAISRAGGVGVWAAARATPDAIGETARSIRDSVGAQPFGLNLMLPKSVPYRATRQDILSVLPEEHRSFVASLWDKYGVPKDGLLGERDRIVRSQMFFEEQISAAYAAPCDFFAMAVGARPAVAEAMRRSGKMVIGLVGSPRHMATVMQSQPDAIVAQGYDAGGHTGNVGTFTLVPRILELAGPTPVLAAGGIGTGRQIAGALAMGASGVWLGTAWLASDEFKMPEPLLSKLIAATCEDTVITKSSSGKPMRQIVSAWSQEWASENAPQPLPMPWQDLLVGSLEGAIERHAVVPLMHTPAGQSVEWVRRRSPVAEIIKTLVTEAEDAMGRLQGG